MKLLTWGDVSLVVNACVSSKIDFTDYEVDDAYYIEKLVDNVFEVVRNNQLNQK